MLHYRGSWPAESSRKVGANLMLTDTRSPIQPRPAIEAWIPPLRTLDPFGEPNLSEPALLSADSDRMWEREGGVTFNSGI